MNINNLPFCTTRWADIAPTEHKGERGVARWHTQQFGDLRVRMVEYSPGYLADHWCSKGHVLLCLEGGAAHRVAGWPRLHPDRGHELSGGGQRRAP